MFGYRLVRQSEIDLLHATHAAQLHTLANEVRRLQADREALWERLSDAREKAAARGSLVDMLTMSKNVLEMEVAQLRSKLTGLPAVVPQMGKASPTASTDLGATASLFDDVGDDLARELKAKGLLADDLAEDLPSAAAERLAPGSATIAQ